MKTIISLLFILFVSFTAYSAGEVDTTFNASVYRPNASNVPFSPSGYSVLTSALQPDGKLLVGGVFGVANGFGRSSVVRLNTDGTADTSFNPPDLYNPNNEQLPGLVNSIVIQPNGKIIVAGGFGVTGSTTRSLIRLNGDGSLDTSFNNLAGQFENTELIYDVALQADGTIYAAGYIELTSSSNVLSSGVVRFDSNGVQDSTFQFARVDPINFNIVKAIAVTPGNSLYASVGTQFSSSQRILRRYNSNGSVDSSFPQITPNNFAEILKIVIQPDGKLLIGGGFSTINNFTQRGLSRITPEGIIDTNFNSGLGNSGTTGGVFDISFTPDNKIVIAGSFSGFGNVTQLAVARLNFDGTRDTTFSSPFTSLTIGRTVEVQRDGKILIYTYNGGTDGILRRLNTNGTFDNSYAQVFFGFAGSINDIVQQADGKIIVGGEFTYAGNSLRGNLARFNADGSPDLQFNQTINVPINVVRKIALQPDGKILVSGASAILRLNADGTRDTSFSAVYNGDFEFLPNGNIIVGGTVRLLPNGVRDNTFQEPNLAGGTVLTTAVQPDGKILIGGTFTQVNAVGCGRIARLNADGTLDATFVLPQGANGNVTDIDLQPDGKIIIVGVFTGLGGDSTKTFIGRLNPGGSLDSTFNTSVNAQPLTIKVQPDRKVLIGGTFTQINGVSRNRYARLNADGTLDNSFIVTAGANAAVNKINLQADGKILLGGNFNRVNNISAVGIARLLNASAPIRHLFDFDGDRKSDISLFRPSNGTWYILPSQTNGFYGFPFGQAGDLIAPADYDGDGRTDVAVFRPVVPGAGDQAYFYVLNSSDGSFRAVAFGTQGDQPMSGDWDGDGKADLAVYRSVATAGGTGNFFYRPSSQPNVNFLTIPLGTIGDKPLYGDFDGDGRLDPAVFRPSTASFIILRSSLNQVQTTTFGVSTDIPVPADYDGDGVTNIAVFRPSNGFWYTNQNPAANFGGIQFGQNGDLPVPADYDGDGKADTTVFRPSNGGWFLNCTTSGLAGVQFGINGDKPAPNAYIP